MTIPTTKRPQRRDGRQHKEECDREGLIGWRRRSASPFHFSALVLVLFLEPTLAAESSVGPGEYCERASQCTSFPILGDAACSSRCTVTARCKDSPLANHPPPFCCAGIPLGLPCSNHRERTCEESLECTPSKTNPQHYQCQDSRSSERNWKIGASLVIASAIMLNLGFNLQKFAYRALQVIPDDARPPAYKVPLWNIGFLVFLGGSLLNLVALKFAAQSLAAPLGGVSLISNAILAPFINNENLTRSDVVAILLILWGTVLVVIFSNHQDKTYTVCELFYLFQRFGTIVYITTLVILLVIVLSFIAKLDRTSRRLRGKLDRFGGITRSLRRAATGFIMSSKAFGARSMDLVPGWIAAKRWKATLSRPSLLGQSYRHALFFSQSRRRRHTEPMPECFSSEYEGFLPRSASHSGIPVPSNARRQHCVSEAFRRFLSGITDGLGGIGSRLECLAFPCLEFQSLEAMKASIAYRYLLPMSYASVGGLLGGMTVLFAKSTAELLTDILEGDLESFRSPYFYVVLVGLLSTGMGQVFFVNQGLERFDALLQMPVYYVVYTMGSVISGGVYFDEFASLTPLQSWMFSLGLCLDLAGVVFLGNRLSRDLNESTPRGGDGSVARSVALDPEDVDEDQVFDDELLSHSRSVEMLCPPDLLEQPLLEEGGDGHLVPRDKYHSISLGVNDRPTSRSLAPFDCPHFVSATSRGASKPRPNLRAGSSPTVSIQNPWLHRRQDPYQAGTPSRPCGGPD